MPIHDLGYRPWEGERTPDSTRWYVIASTGIRVALRSAWLRRMLLFAWLPAIYAGAMFFAFEQLVTSGVQQPIIRPDQQLADMTPGQVRDIAAMYRISLHEFTDEQIQRQLDAVKQGEERVRPVIENIDDRRLQEHLLFVNRRFEQQSGRLRQQYNQTLFEKFIGDVQGADVVVAELNEHQGQLDKARPTVWSWILMTFFRAPQGIAMVLLVGLIAPTLIANDVRSKAFLLYFSRPISLFEYVLGKAAVIWFFVALITTIPALGLYLLAVALSPDLSVLANTWHLPLLILLASAVLMIPTSAIALMLSSLTSESRFAGFAWFTLWALGFAAYMMVNLPWGGRGEEPRGDEWKLMSMYHTLGEVQVWVFNLGTNTSVFWSAVAILSALTVFSLLVLSRRVSAPIRI